MKKEPIPAGTVETPGSETPLERAYRLGEGCGGLDAAGVKRLVELDRENARGVAK